MGAEGTPGVRFRHYAPGDYEAVCGFLLNLCEADHRCVNWNWARFEWMMEHPEFHQEDAGAMGLWTLGDRVVGAAIYDMYFGEAFCGVLPDHADLYPAVLDYAWENLRDEKGLGVAVPDGDRQKLDALEARGFVPAEQTETIQTIRLDRDLRAPLPEGLRFASPDPVEDAERLQWLFWQGFDHGEDREEFLREDPVAPRVRPHFDPRLGVAAENEAGELVSICCLWHLSGTDYAYVEPVCTVPAYRGRGAARAVIFEALTRARTLGAEKAHVISDMEFYEKLGFSKEYHYTFHWKK